MSSPTVLVSKPPARDVMEKYGKTVEDLKSRMLLFNYGQEHMDNV